MFHPKQATTARVVVVDPQLNDYRCLAEPARKRQVRLTLTGSGSNALRLAPSFVDAVWVINTRLPDMDGFDLLEMLRSLKNGLRIAVIDDQYEPERERQALQLGALQYVCKPVQLNWFWSWQKQKSTVSEVHEDAQLVSPSHTFGQIHETH